MAHQPSLRVVAAAAALGALGVASVRCSGDPTSPAPTGPKVIRSCDPLKVYNVPDGAGISLNKPASCPIDIPYSVFLDYAGTITLPRGTVDYGFMSSSMATWLHPDQTYSIAISAQWSTGASGDYLVQASGRYDAGSDGIDGSTGYGYDDIYHRFVKGGDSVVIGYRIRYDYKSGSGDRGVNEITAPHMVQPGDTYEVSAVTHDPVLRYPVTWSWYIDGTFVGSTDTPSTTVGAPSAPFSSQSVQVVASDPYGRSAVGSALVSTGSGCSGSQVSC
jgi:hypothetical protein